MHKHPSALWFLGLVAFDLLAIPSYLAGTAHAATWLSAVSLQASSAEINITTTGFDPPVAGVTSGNVFTWTNSTAVTQTLQSGRP